MMNWMEESSPNSLADVFKHYCPGQPELKKAQRETFVKGDMEEVRNNFQVNKK